MPQTDSNNLTNGPKKVLHIYDAVFVLPDDFSGTIQDAMKLFLEYQNKVSKENIPESKIDPNRLFTPLGILTVSRDKIKCCMEARLYELKDGYYVEMEETDNSSKK